MGQSPHTPNTNDDPPAPQHTRETPKHPLTRLSSLFPSSNFSMSNTAASSGCSPMHSAFLFSTDFISIPYQLQVKPLLGISQTLKYAAPHLKTTLTHLEHLYFYCFSINNHPILPGSKRVYRQDCDLNTRQCVSCSTKTWTFQI